MKSNVVLTKEYKAWLAELKQKVRNAQLKAAIKINTELLLFYWELGADLVAKQAKSKWGDGVIDQLSKDLTSEFPEMKGFSLSNIKYIKQWYLFYSKNRSIGQQPVGQLTRQPVVRFKENAIGQQLVGQITRIPWGHNIVIITRCKNIEEALFYVHNTMKYNWSRSVLAHHIESGLYRREGKSVSNFSVTLPRPQSDLALQTLKDPYVFDFLTLAKEHSERELENALVHHMTKFLLELGVGFAYVGRQVPLKVGESDFYIDLLFYHLKLRCYVVIELKTTAFQPEFAGKMNFYLKAMDEQVRVQEDNPTVGILICKKKDKLVAEYALSDVHKPIGISEYKLTHKLPKELKASLPTIEEIENELEMEKNKAGKKKK